MLNQILTASPLVIILVLILALLIVGTGRGLGDLAGLFLKKLLGKGDVNINLGGDMAKIPKECEGCGLAVDPAKCAMHQAEHERSLNNKEGIKDLWIHYGEMKKEMTAGFKEIQQSINKTQETILGALAGDRNGFSKIGRGGGE